MTAVQAVLVAVRVRAPVAPVAPVALALARALARAVHDHVHDHDRGATEGGDEAGATVDAAAESVKEADHLRPLPAAAAAADRIPHDRDPLPKLWK